MKHIVCTVAAFVFLSACQTTNQAASSAVSAPMTDDEIATSLAGKSLGLDGLTILVGEDGSLSGREEDGREISGTWSVQNGQWCRTLTSPAEFAGSACQSLEIEGDIATINGNAYTIS